MSKKPLSQLARTARYNYRKECEENEKIMEALDQASEIPPSKVPRLSDTSCRAGPGSDVTVQSCNENFDQALGLSGDFCNPILNASSSTETRIQEATRSVRENSSEDSEDNSSDICENTADSVEDDVEKEENTDREGSEREYEEHDEEENVESQNESDDDDNNEERMNHEARRNFDPPLYTGASITVAQSMLLILALLLKHNVTGSCLSDIITVINFHCLSQGLKKNSLFKFRKYFGRSEKVYTKHYYCSVCLTSLDSACAICSSCGVKKDVSYFIQMPFLEQLEEMFMRKGFHDLLQHRFQRERPPHFTYSDIYDGSLYSKYMLGTNGFLDNPNNISLTWNTDGVPVFKSSKISMWPVFLTVNELPYKHRMSRGNTLLAGLWFGNKKPAANNFIYKLRPDFEILLRGKACTLPGGSIINVRGILLCGTCDLPAKAEFLNMVAHNGNFGCTNCLNSGETFKHDTTGGTSHVYRYEQEPQMRCTADTVENGLQALRNGKPVNGVKGPCAFSKIMPDFIAGVAIDCMHCMFCGVAKRLLSLWFDSPFSRYPFSLSAVTAIIDTRLIQIKPPKFVHRMPRSVTDLCHWKASELRMWFYYYSLVVLEGIMRKDYFEHYLCLVGGISILNSECITPEQLKMAKDLLHKFVKGFETLYGLKFCTINVHQLLHLPVCVERLGPLWAYSCFPYENLNGKLLSLVNGTSHIESQVAMAHTYLIQMKRRLDELPGGAIRDFAVESKHQVKICERIFTGCYSVGTYNKFEAFPTFIEQAMVDSRIAPGNVSYYTRLLKASKLYVSEMYDRTLKTISSCINYTENCVKKFGAIRCFLKISNCICVMPCLCEAVHYAIVSEIVTQKSYRVHFDNVDTYLSHLHKCHRTNRKFIIPLATIESVCVYMNIDDQSYIGIPINAVELE